MQSTYLAIGNNYNKLSFIEHELYFGCFIFNFLIFVIVQIRKLKETKFSDLFKFI